MNDVHIEHVDVLIVGAGLSGIGAACHLQEKSPGKTYAILESRESMGGTWDLFKYPGLRSDSDMFTLGYRFRPWTEAKAIADGPSILQYIKDTARDHHVSDKIRYGHRVVRAEWSSTDGRWTVTAERTDTGETFQITCGFLHTCCGYYRYDEGFTPDFPGADRFNGKIIHPQHWPEDFDYSGKRIVVIGSGATAITLIPSLAERAEHVTMLQRSPSYVFTLPARDPIADFLRSKLPAKVAYPIVRWKNVILAQVFFQASRRIPKVVKRIIRESVQRQLPEGYDVDKHFKPSYDPWDQRVCLVPDGDFFRSIRRGKASIETGRIASFTESGLSLESGTQLDADVIVTATGLNVLLLGGMKLRVDGEDVDVSKTFSYKGMMLSGVPNLSLAVGYTNASWTLKCDLVSEYVCRLVNHMDKHGYSHVTPLPPSNTDDTLPFIDLASGYVLRAIDQLPRQGMKAPWRLHQNYPLDVLMLRRGRLEDAGICFSRRSNTPVAAPAPSAEPATEPAVVTSS